MFPLDVPPVRFIACATIGHWSSGCHNSRAQHPTQGLLSQISYSLVVILELSGILEVQYKKIIMSNINKNN